MSSAMNRVSTVPGKVGEILVWKSREILWNWFKSRGIFLEAIKMIDLCEQNVNYAADLKLVREFRNFVREKCGNFIGWSRRHPVWMKVNLDNL